MRGTIGTAPPWLFASALTARAAGIGAAEPIDETRPQGAYDWGLKLPDNPVLRRTSRVLTFEGDAPQVLDEMEGPGCIRRFWTAGRNIGRDVVLWIYFDNQLVPYVETPLSDFFGIMHNLPQQERGQTYRINTPLLAVKPKNGMTCCFPMPFAKKARFEVTGTKGRKSCLYYMIEWHAYPGRELDEPTRFCARWRRECPAVPYADQFLTLDADGTGRLIGFVYSVDMLDSCQKMRWSHAGTAQSKSEKEPSDENNRAFEAALRKLIAYRASVEADNVCNFGHAAFRGENGSGWKHKF